MWKTLKIIQMLINFEKSSKLKAQERFLTESHINNSACQFHQSRVSNHEEVNETSIDIRCSWKFSLVNTTMFLVFILSMLCLTSIEMIWK